MIRTATVSWLAHALLELEVLFGRSWRRNDDETRFFMDAEIYRALNRLSDALVDARDALDRFGQP